MTTALHVSGVTITHPQEHKTTVTTASGNRYTVLLSVAIVEEFQLYIRYHFIMGNDLSACKEREREKLCKRDRRTLCKESTENFSHFDVRDGKPRFT